MNIFSKQAARNPVFTVLMALLLSLSVALSCIGYSAWSSAGAQRNEISGGYTTIAIPKAVDLTSISVDEVGLALQNRIWADWAAQEAPQLTMIDRRYLLSAHVAGQKSLSSSRFDPLEYNIAFDSGCYFLSVFALRCKTVKTDVYTGYDAEFLVEEAVCLSDAYDCFPAPDSVHIMGQEPRAPFQAGKTYLVVGGYQDYRVVAPLLQSDERYVQERGPGSYRFIIPLPELPGHGEFDDSAPVSLPWVSEYTGTVADYLASEDGAVWRDEIIPLCQLNQDSAPVILTDCATSIYAFNTGEASLLSGRFFTDEEYATGADVCMVSASYAELNGLRLGDTLQLDYYDSGWTEWTNGGLENSLLAEGSVNPYTERYYMAPADAIGVCKEYTIVGIYTGARFSFGAYHFNADTILVPKASIPNGAEYEESASVLLNTFILENGSSEEFEQYMEQQDLGGQFLYFDQDFTAMEESLEALEANAMRLMLVGAGICLLVFALFLFLNFRRMKPAIRGVRLLGRPAKTVFAEITAVLLLLTLLAVAAGAAAAAVLFDAVTQAVLSSALALQPQSILIAAAAAFAVFAVAGMIGTAVCANRKLMKSK